MILRELIAEKISKASGVNQELVEKLVFFPEKKEFGDASVKCFALASILKKKPEEAAAELAKKLNGKKEFKEVTAVNAFCNIWFSDAFLFENLKEVYEKGISPLKKEKKKIMVEFSQPNPNKPMHLGHLRNDFLGMSISKTKSFLGNRVIKVNLINDRGIHICQMMTAYKNYGNNETPESTKMKGDHFIGKYYVLFQKKVKEKPELNDEAHKMLEDWEKGDKKVRELWKKLVSFAVAGFNETYELIGSEFDEWFYESNYYDKAKPLIDLGMKKKVFVEDEERGIKTNLKSEKLPDKTVLRGDGTSIYFTNDLALTKHKVEDYDLDECFWVVASEQSLYFQQLFATFKLLGFEWYKKCKHLNYGLVLLPEGKMKSREGKVVDADNLINKIKDLAKKELKKREEKNVEKEPRKKLNEKELEKRAMTIALAALKFYLINHELHKDILFVPEKTISFEGRTGAYLLYSYARANSILKKTGAKRAIKDFKGYEFNEIENELLNKFSVFNDVLLSNGSKLEMHLICSYLLELAALFNSFYNKVPVLNGTEEETKVRLVIVELFMIHLKKGLELLNIEVLDEM